MKPAHRTALTALRSACRNFVFRPHDIAQQLDAQGRYELPLEKDFPFHIALFHLRSGQYTPTWNWHERLELTIPLDGPLHMRMGEESVKLGAGDLLIVDNLKLHNYEDFPGFDTRVVTFTFLPEFVYTPGSPVCDYTFLLPFYAKRIGQPYVLPSHDESAPPVLTAMVELLQRYFGPGQPGPDQCGCKASFLQILYQLTRRFEAVTVQRADFVRHRQRVERLARLFEFVRLNYAERIDIAQAAKLAHLSQPQFMRLFREVTGMTFIAYLTRVRLTQALRLLRETERSVAEIAASAGFSDQSYFDRRFRHAFGRTPRECRADGK